MMNGRAALFVLGLMLLSLVGSPAMAGLGGDTCAQPTILTGPLPVMTSGDTTGLADDVDLSAAGACASGTQEPFTGLGPDAIYAFALDANCALTFTLTPTSGANLSMYLVTDCGDVAAGCVNVSDSGGAGETETISQIVFADTLYRIIVDGVAGSSGTFDLSVSELSQEGCTLRALNDICEFSTGSNEGFSTSGDTSADGTLDDYVPMGCVMGASAGLGPDSVYRLTPANDCNVQVTLSPTSGADLALYTSTSCIAINETCVAGSDMAGAGGMEELFFEATAGTTYYIFVDGVNFDAGAFDLDVVCGFGACCLPLGCMELDDTACAALGGVDAGVMFCTDADTDSDGVPDVCDGCPNDPEKIFPGICGCGVSETVGNAAIDVAFGGNGPFDRPRGIAVDAAGRIYVADSDNDRVQVFDSAGSFLFEFGSPGMGAGQFGFASGIAVDGAGRIHVVDVDNDRVSVFDINGDFLFAFGGTGTGNGEFNRPRGIAVDASGLIYVTDTDNNRIQVFDTAGSFQFTFGSGGSGDGEFNFPQGIAVDGSGRICVVDRNNSRVQVFDSGGGFQFEFGSGGSGNGQFNSPRGVSLDGAGQIYVADSNSDRIQVFSSSGVFLFTFGSVGTGIGQFDSPEDIAVDRAGRMYVVDTRNDRVQVFNPVAADLNMDGGPDCLPGACCTSQGCIDLSSTNCGFAGGVYLGDGTTCAQEGVLGCVPGACCTGQGCMFVTETECAALGGASLGINVLCSDGDSDGDGVRDECDLCPMDPMKTQPGTCGCGVMDEVIGSSFAFGYSNPGGPRGLAVDGAGRIYSLGFNSSEVRIHDSAGVFLDSFGSFGTNNGQFNFPRGLHVDDSRIYVADSVNNRVQVFTLGGGFLFAFGSSGTGDGQFISPRDIATDQMGRIYVAEAGDRVQVFDSFGSFLFAFGSFGTANGEFQDPNGIAVDANGQIYVTEEDGDRVQVFDSAGTFQFTFGSSGSGDGQFTFPYGIDVDSAGRIYVAELGNDRVQVFDNAGAFLFSFDGSNGGGTPFNNAWGLALDGAGRIHVADTTNDNVQVFDAIVAACPAEPCPWDCMPDNGDGTFGNGEVNIDDLLQVLNSFGDPGGPCDSSPDNGDGTFGNGIINIDDLLAVINNFGACP
ncbi:MAG: 6-bladed beta-propeller [Planctomycetota bacterium]